MRNQRPMVSTMGWSSVDQVVVRGHDLCEDVLGTLSLGDLAYLEITGRKPSPAHSVMFNAMLCTLVEHGMTPSAMVARLTYLGAPESLQGAVAAGLCGLGTHFAGTAEGAARLLYEALEDEVAPESMASIAHEIVAECVRKRQPIPGLGHPLHKPIDPRAAALFRIAGAQGLSGRYVGLMTLVSAEAERQLDKPGGLPVNATGAIGALACELGLPWRLCRGLAVIGRAVGLVGHIAEEISNPIATELWLRTDEEVSRPAVEAAAKEIA